MTNIPLWGILSVFITLRIIPIMYHNEKKASESTSSQDHFGWAGSIAYFFIKNSRLSILLIISLFVWGIISYVYTPKKYNPTIVAPSFQVYLQAPSADSEEFYDRITKPVEDALVDIPGVEDVLSKTMEGGHASITANFYVGEDVEQSKIQVRQKVDEVRNELPGAVNHITISENNPEDVPVLTLALTSETLDKLQVRKFAVDLHELLKKVDQVTNVEIHGGDKRELRITLLPEKLNEHKIDPRIIIGKIKKTNYRLIVGDDIEDQGEHKKIEVNGLWMNLDDAKTMKVATTDDFQPVFLADVARVETVAEETTQYARFSTKDDTDKDAVFLSLAKEEGSNITVVTDRILERLKTIDIPEEIAVNVVRNDGQVAREEVQGLTANLFTSIAIVALVLLFTLGWRTALVVATSIPLTLAIVFGVGLLAGQTINRITLFALILSLGLLVDDAIVVIENAVRHLEKRLHPDKDKAIAQAVGEVGGGVSLATLTTVVSFIPMFFVTGMMGPYMGPIPFFVPAALIGSLVVAYTLNPYLASILFPYPQDSSSSSTKSTMHKPTLAIRIGSTIKNGYKKLLATLLSNKKLTVAVLAMVFVAGIISASLPFLQVVKFRMLPKDDKEQFYVYLDYPDSTTLDDNLAMTEDAEAFFLASEYVESVQSFVGMPPITDFNGLFRGVGARNEDNQATLRVNLTHPGERSLTSEEIVLAMRKDFEQAMARYDDVRIKMMEDAPGPPVRSTLMLKVKGQERENITEEHREKLKMIAHDFEQYFMETAGVEDVDTSVDEPLENLSFLVDTAKATKMGVYTKDIIDALDVALNGQVIGLYRDSVDKERENIVIRFGEEYEKDIEKIRNLYVNYVPTVKAAMGEGDIVKLMREKQVPLLDVVSIEPKRMDNQLCSENRSMMYAINAEMGDRSVVYAALDILGTMLSYELPFTGQSRLVGWNLYEAVYEDEATGFRYVVEWDGEWELTLDVFRDLGLAMLVAIFLVFVILVAQFRKFRIPLIILVTIPLALIGVMPGYALIGATLGVYFNATSMIGVIALSGIVVNDAIVMIEYLHQLLGKGWGLKDALVEAASTRMRSIVLTSVTTILGSLTLIADPVWAGLGWSIVFGMVASTLLILLVLPALYSVVNGKKS